MHRTEAGRDENIEPLLGDKIRCITHSHLTSTTTITALIDPEALNNQNSRTR